AQDGVPLRAADRALAAHAAAHAGPRSPANAARARARGLGPGPGARVRGRVRQPRAEDPRREPVLGDGDRGEEHGPRPRRPSARLRPAARALVDPAGVDAVAAPGARSVPVAARAA